MLRYLLQTPRSTPIPALFWDFGVLPIEHRVENKKLNFLKHIVSLDDNSLAKQVFNTQREFNFPGFVNETRNLIKIFDLPDITKSHIHKQWPKRKWKKVVKSNINEKCENDLKIKIKNMKKLKSGPMAEESESFSQKQYLSEMTVTDARVNFKLRSQMLDVKYNYSHDPKYTSDLWKCDSCQSAIETQSHILWCPSYSDLRIGKDINNDKDLINYIKSVMKARDNLNLIK